MANNLEDCDGYIIIGVTNNGDVCGVPETNRKNQQNVIDFLKDKAFAGGVRPTVYVQCLDIENKSVDVIIVKNTVSTPYYLEKEYDGLHKGNIYTRIVDTNTPKNSNADIDKVEWLWKKRFGINANIKDRFLMLLDQYEQWEISGGVMPSSNMRAFHKNFPEFSFETDHENKSEFIIAQSFILYDEARETKFVPIKLFYFNVIIFEFLLNIDHHIPESQHRYLSIRHLDFMPNRLNEYIPELHYKPDILYNYYDLSEVEGKLLKIMTAGFPNNCNSIPFPTLYLIFENNAEHEHFRNFALENYNKLDIDSIKQKFKSEITQDIARYSIPFSKFTQKDFSEVLSLLIASELYRLWKSGNDYEVVTP